MRKTLKNIKGIIPAVFTPFAENGDLTTKPLHKYIRYLLGAGCDGFFISGANGECFLQNADERIRFVDAFTCELAGEKPAIFHVGSINPQESYLLAKKAKELQVDAISSVVPFYYGYSIKEISEYYKKLIALSELPLIVYYVPENTGTKIDTREFIDKIINLPGVAGIKYTNPDLYQLQLLANGRNDGSLMTYGGFDQMGVPFLTMGVDGLIGATFSLIPEVYVKMYASFKSGKLQKAMDYQQIANRFSVEIKKYGRSAYKAFLALRGIDTGKPRACWTEISSDDIKKLERILQNVLLEIEAVD